LRRFDLVEVGGTVAPFAGTGWDAEIIDDFHAQKTGFGFLPARARNGLAGRGAVLYRGPTSVCAAATSAEWGFGFRAFPFAGLVPRRFNFRIYAGRAL